MNSPHKEDDINQILDTQQINQLTDIYVRKSSLSQMIGNVFALKILCTFQFFQSLQNENGSMFCYKLLSNMFSSKLKQGSTIFESDQQNDIYIILQGKVQLVSTSLIETFEKTEEQNKSHNSRHLKRNQLMKSPQKSEDKTQTSIKDPFHIKNQIRISKKYYRAGQIITPSAKCDSYISQRTHIISQEDCTILTIQLKQYNILKGSFFLLKRPPSTVKSLRKRNLTYKLNLFQSWHVGNILDFLITVKSVDYRQGDLILQNNSFEGYIYIVSEGVIEVQTLGETEDENHQKRLVKSKISGHVGYCLAPFFVQNQKFYANQEIICKAQALSEKVSVLKIEFEKYAEYSHRFSKLKLNLEMLIQCQQNCEKRVKTDQDHLSSEHYRVKTMVQSPIMKRYKKQSGSFQRALVKSPSSQLDKQNAQKTLKSVLETIAKKQELSSQKAYSSSYKQSPDLLSSSPKSFNIKLPTQERLKRMFMTNDLGSIGNQTAQKKDTVTSTREKTSSLSSEGSVNSLNENKPKNAIRFSQETNK